MESFGEGMGGLPVMMWIGQKKLGVGVQKEGARSTQPACLMLYVSVCQLHVFILCRSSFCGFLVFGPCVPPCFVFSCAQRQPYGWGVLTPFARRRVERGHKKETGVWGAQGREGYMARNIRSCPPPPGTTHSQAGRTYVVPLQTTQQGFSWRKSRAAGREVAACIKGA